MAERIFIHLFSSKRLLEDGSLEGPRRNVRRQIDVASLTKREKNLRVGNVIVKILIRRHYLVGITGKKINQLSMTFRVGCNK